MCKMSETHQYHEIRAHIATEGAKALLIINGGGIVALLGFLSTIWRGGDPVVITAILQGIWLLAIGLTSTVANYFFRYWASTSFQREWTIRHRIFWLLEWLSVAGSFILFLSALYVIVTGAQSVIDARA